MKKIPSISNEIDEDKIFKIINKNFSKLAPAYYMLVTNWLIDATLAKIGLIKPVIKPQPI
jgi:hypothetical protein